MKDRTRVTVLSGGADLSKVVTRLRLAHGDLKVLAEPQLDIAAHEIDLDPVIGWRSPGCPCCRIHLGLIDAIRNTCENPDQPPHLLVVLSAPDVITALQTLISDPDLLRLCELGALLVSEDGVALSTRIAEGLPLASAASLDLLPIADRILITRPEMLTPRAGAEILNTFATINRVGESFYLSDEPNSNEPNCDAVLKELLHLHAWHGSPTLSSDCGREAADVNFVYRHSGETAETVILEVEQALNPEAVQAWIDEVIEAHGSRILRLQGALSIIDDKEPERICCHGILSYATCHSESQHHAGKKSTSSRMVVIGYGLNESHLRRGFEAAVSR
jgi:G3E family GTPase